MQDTGGFFVAVLKKTAPFVVPNPGRAAAAEAAAEAAEAAEAVAAATATSSAAQTPASEDMSEAKEDTQEEVEEEDKATTGDKHKLDSPAGSDSAEAAAKKPRMSRAERFGAPGPKEEPFLFLDSDNADVQLFSRFYGLDEKFPKDQFLVRSEGEKNKTIYFVSEAVKSILQSEEIHRLKVYILLFDITLTWLFFAFFAMVELTTNGLLLSIFCNRW